MIQIKIKSLKTLHKSEILFRNHVLNLCLVEWLPIFIKDGTEYYVINYDDTSSLTNTVTENKSRAGS